MGISQILHEYVLANITLLLKLQMHDARDITALCSFVGIPSFRSFLSSAPEFGRLDVGARVQLPKPRRNHLAGGVLQGETCCKLLKIYTHFGLVRYLPSEVVCKLAHGPIIVL